MGTVLQLGEKLQDRECGDCVALQLGEKQQECGDCFLAVRGEAAGQCMKMWQE